MKIDKLTVTDATPATVAPSVFCTRIRCIEDRQATGWPHRVIQTFPTGQSGNLGEGAEADFLSGPYQPNQAAGTLQLISGDGSTTFLIIQEVA